MKWITRTVVALTLGMMAWSTNAEAALIIQTLPEFNGPYDDSAPWETFTVGTFTFTIPVEEEVVAATINGTFGVSGASSSAGVDLFLDSILVGQCVDQAPCWQGGPTPWSHVFSEAELSIFADAGATLLATQTSPFYIQLGETTLELTTAPVGQQVPEPTSLLLLGTGAAGFFASTRRRGKQRSDVR